MMASSEKDSMYSSDEEKLHPRRRKKQQNVISTSDTDGDESDYEIRPRRLKKRKHFDSDSDLSVHGNSPVQNSGSDNEQAEKCAICLSKFLGQDIATPEACDHVFCLECLQQWAKNVNTCPIDRLKFNLILIRHHKEEKIIKTLIVNNSELPYCSDVESEYTAMVQEAEYCGLCGEEGASLRCRHCSKLYHENCIISLLGSSTPRSWQCPSCDHFIDIRELYTGILRSSLSGALHNLQTQVHDIRTQSRRRVEHFLGTRLRQDYIYRRSILRTLLSTSESSEEENNPALSFIQKAMHKSRLTTKRRNQIFRARNQAFVSATATANAEMRSHYNADSDEGYNDLSTLSSTSAAQENFDLVGSILQSQSLLHCPDYLTLSRDGTVLRNSSAASSPTRPSTQQVADENGLIFSNSFPLLNDITVSPLAAQAAVKERPSNPSQTASKYSEIPMQPHTYSSPGGTLERGYSYNETVLSRTSLASNNDDFNNDPCLPILSKSFCNSSLAHEDAKKDGRTTKGAHPSEDEVDIYSDIESVGDDEEGPLNDHHPQEQMKIAFKSNDDVAQLSNNDGSDSSDNDLVIDEDMQAEEEGKIELHNSGLKCSTSSYKIEEECEYGDDVKSDKVEADTMEPEKACSFGENSSDNCYNIGNESSQDASPYIEEDNDSKSKTAENHDSENDECLPKSDIECDVFSNGEDNDSQSKITDHNVHGSDNDECLPKSDIECDEDSLDSSKRSNQGDMFSSAKSSPKSCKGDTNDGFDSTYENHVSNKESGSHQKNSFKSEKREGSDACENTCDSESRAEDNSNLELDSYSEHNKDVSSIGSDENVQTGTKTVNFDFTSQNTSCEGSEDMAPESTRNSENQDLVDICQDIVMKSDEEDNFDSTENASTPCLDEPMDGHIENSPQEQEDSENFSGTSPNTPDEGTNSIYNENSALDNRSQYMDGPDLDVEDVSEAESDNLKDEVTLHTENEVEGLEQEVDSPQPDSENYSSNKQASDYHSPSNISDQEEGEIIEERPVHKCITKKREKSSKEEEYGPKINISDLPRIPKLNRDKGKEPVPASTLSDTKRISVLSRVDLGNNDINWKKPSKHTKERSYRDGRPKDEKLMFKERESRNKDRHTVESSRRSDKNNERKRDEKKKQNNEKYKNDSSYSRKSSKTKSNDYSYSDRDKRKSHKDKHLKDKYPKEKEKDKHDKRKHSKESERGKGKEDLRYDRELHCTREERFERYDKSKAKDKEHKSKYKERKTEKKDSSKSSRDHSRDKHKRSHTEDHFSEKQKDREVRKIDDKLKIVVEQKDTRKEKAKHKERQDLKHEKKPIIQRKLISDKSYSDVTSIESKEIFAKGDSIIINVNFNRATSPKVNSVSDTADVPLKDKKVASEDLEFDKKKSTVSSKSKSKNGVCDRNRTSVESCKRPSTPAEKNQPVLSVSESYWQGGDDSDANNSPASEKSEELDPVEENETTSPQGYDIENCSMSSSSSDVNVMQSSPKDPTSDLDEASAHSEKDTSNKDGENFNSNRRSPTSPPSPADNDSYDPCEPTRSPSPQPPPLPTSNPKPPPSPELPPLPPEPEPVDIQEGCVKTIPSADFVVSSAAMVSSASQPVTVHTQTSSPLMLQNMLPPPSFLSQVSSIAKSMSSLVPSQSGTFPINTHATVMIPSNHVHHQVMGGFMPPHMHVSTALPPPPNPPNMPRIGSVPPPPPPPAAMTLLSHQHLNVQPTLTPNTLLQTLTMAHAVNAPPLQLVHHLPPNLSGILSNHQVTLAQNQSAMSILSQQNSRILMPQNPSLNHGVMFHNQNVCTTKLPTENSNSAKQDTAHKQAEKPVKQMTPNDKYEVIDMDVDTPYSPGDSPSVESGGGGYSPRNSPLPSSPRERDSAFDTLFGGDSRTPEKRPYDAVSSSEKAKPSSKKSKHEQKLDSRHTQKIQGKDKHKKSRKDLKAADKKELAGKFEDSQLKILDELPSSAVEMQVKEKFLKKLNRQERVVEEVKIILKPYYKSKDVTKEEYKDILRRAVPKICHNKSGDINPVKVKHLVESYVKKAKHSRKRRKKFS